VGASHGLIDRLEEQRSFLGPRLGTLGFAVAVGAAYLGGRLVYTEQIGADHTIGSGSPMTFEH
jgi:hypothetical protein